MAVMKLTDRSASAAKVEPGQRLELWDETTPGLCLRVSAKRGTGAPVVKRVWVWRYRTADGRQPRMTLGDYSAKHSLKWAREQVEDLRVQVRKATADPAAERRAAKAAARAETLRTFDDLADAYLRACEDGHWQPRNKRKRARTLEDERGVLRRHVRPVLGKHRLEDITRRQVRELLRRMVDRGIGAQTNKAHQVMRQIFAWAVSEERLVMNPAVGFLPLASQTPRARTLSDAELKLFWGGLSAPERLRSPPAPGQVVGEPVLVGRPMCIALQLSILLLQRRSEIAGMRTEELNLDQATWLIPGARMKGGSAHLVPLPPEAVVLIKEALSIADELERRRSQQGEDWKPRASRPVFPSPRDADKSVRGDSITHAMRLITAAVGVEGVSPHDLRRTGSTAMTSERLGISPFIRSKVLGHSTDAGGGAAVSAIHYDANSYIAEKRRALEAWEGLLLEVVGVRARPSNVSALRQPGAA